MDYAKHEAKAHARETMRGIWAAALTPFDSDLRVDEAGLRANIRHWIGDLGIAGLFMAGKQGEFWALSLDERKRLMTIAAEECRGRAGTIMSISDQSVSTVLELGRHAEACGADYVVVHAPMLSFCHDRDEILYEYYKYLCDRLDIGIAMWSHPDAGYLMEPETCARIAELPNIMAIKYSVPREMYARLTRLAGDKILVSTSREDDWLDNIEALGWQLYLCSSPPYQLQTKADQRMNEYTELAFAGRFAEARRVRDSLEPVRAAIRDTKPGSKPTAHGKYWQDLLGQVGGPVRHPMLNLTEAEKDATRAAFEGCGLRL
ncbi:dihydrodipicolinate synthase family protein [Jannaschia seohaensis]|uniref:4-hydroxy-tetrahydrodipicolinate synthase n=1 Tax=Jannaschia seohaensis TaxID=475081 RepID=A0A2Y9B022_9RHOB|nr:dihydrodipicolinate synthase family protein [Jannaschia seohaensis]PWJ16966.1 4-hydroxy-tetrahydrodipicolinate synthase [Jannaschia seohaensis]SSA48237.1 4-hydroxy-tetrahydrodipicolinate synthase [Jannaschia seohaensis]